MGKIFDWIDSRFGVKDPHRRFLWRPLPPKMNYSYCLGGIAFTLFFNACCHRYITLNILYSFRRRGV
ncbi:MAG: hypothetical protein AB1348_05735 [Nitrospirota bacterium]